MAVNTEGCFFGSRWCRYNRCLFVCFLRNRTCDFHLVDDETCKKSHKLKLKERPNQLKCFPATNIFIFLSGCWHQKQHMKVSVQSIWIFNVVNTVALELRFITQGISGANPFLKLQVWKIASKFKSGLGPGLKKTSPRVKCSVKSPIETWELAQLTWASKNPDRLA